MAKKTKAEPRPAPPAVASAQEVQEELAFLRQKCNSLSFRGHYEECVKTIEEHLDALYRKERWPENFFAMLRLHQRCYPSLNKDQAYDEYLSSLLQSHKLPLVFAALLREPDSAIVWTAENFKNLALENRAKGNFEIALGYCDLLVKIDPGASNAWLLRGWILEDMERIDDALEMYRRSLELDARNHLTMSRFAALHEKRSPKLALEYLEQAIEVSPASAEYYSRKAALLRGMGDADGALAALDEAVKNDPYDPEYPYQRGEIYHAAGTRVKAISQFRMAVALNENHVPSLLRLVEYSREKQPDLALSYLATVCALEPENIAACLTRARLLRRVGNLDAAVKQYRLLLELDPASHEAWGALGKIALAQENASDALQNFAEALRLAPKGEHSAKYLRNQGRAHRFLGDNEAAAASFKASLAMDDRNARAWAELGALTVSAKPKEALRYYHKALALDAENAGFHSALGELLLQMPDSRAAALESLNRACRYDPGNAALHARLGRLLEEFGNAASAMAHYKAAVALQSADYDTLFRLACLQVDTRPDLALLNINTAIRLSVVRGEYYHAKARILLALSQDAGAMALLRETMEREDSIYSEDDAEELEQLFSDNGRRIALVYIDRALEMKEDNTSFLCLRAGLLYQLGQREKARNQYHKLLEKDPACHEALFGMGQILADRRDAKALEYFDKAIAIAPGVAEYYAEKGFFQEKQDAWREAVEAFAEAFAHNNQLWRVLLHKARLLDGHDELEPAMAEYRRVLLLRPDTVEATARMGVLLADISPQTALPYLDHAVHLEPENYLHAAWRGRVLLELGKAEEAEEELERAVSLGQESAATRFAIATLLRPRAPEKALELCLLALEQDPGKPEYHVLLADLEADRLDYGAARAAYARAAELAPGLHEPLEKLAHAGRLLQAHDAAELAEAALQNRPDCPVCLAGMAYLREEDGDIAAALELVEAAVKLAPEELPLREFYVKVLTRRKSFVKAALEKRRLEKLRRRLQKPVAAPEPPPFEMEPLEVPNP